MNAVQERAAYDLQARRQALPTVALALELGLFERIEAERHTASTLAVALEVSLRACEVLASVCAALGLMRIAPDGSLSCSDRGRTHMLRASPSYGPPPVPPDHPGLLALRRAVKGQGNADHELAVNMGAMSEDNARSFIRQMHDVSSPAGSALARLPVFSGVRELLDVGGGSGSLSCALASAHPEMRCSVMDLPSVCRVTAELIAGSDVSDRVTCVPSDMFTSIWPGERDAILFGNVFHDWDLETCGRLARSAFAALKPGGIVALHEMLLDEDHSGPLAVACSSVTMLLFERGRQYTAGELRQVLKRAGFTDFLTSPTVGYYSLLQGRKP